MKTLLALRRGYGSTRALADALGVSASTVSRWLRDGPTPSGEARIRALSAELDLVAAGQADDLRNLTELMALAAITPSRKPRRSKKTGELIEDPNNIKPLLPKQVKDGLFKRVGPKTVGLRYTKGFNAVLRPPMRASILQWLSTAPARFPLWQAVIVVSQYGKGEWWGQERDRVKKYRSVFFQFPHPATEDFAVEVEAMTKVSRRKAEIIKHIDKLIDEMFAVSPTIVFIHSVSIFNYRKRTDRQRKDWETFQRRKRKKEKAARDKRNLRLAVASALTQKPSSGSSTIPQRHKPTAKSSSKPAKKPTAKKPTVKKPTAKKPAAKKPTAKPRKPKA